jgi:hypothetical protein
MMRERTPAEEAFNRDVNDFAANLKRPITEYIDTVTTIFRQAHEDYPEEELPPVVYHKVATDDPHTYNHQRGFTASDKFRIQPMIMRVRSARGKPEAKRGDVMENYHMQKYADFRSHASSSLHHAIEKWDELNPQTERFSWVIY